MALVTALVWFFAFLFSTTVHEAMHAFAAWRLGDPTAYHGGQVSLSPVPHMRREPIGMLVLPLITSFANGWAIGWASAPYDAHWAARFPKRAAVMAAAGPLGNFLIAASAFAILRLGLETGWFTAPDRVRFESLVELAPGGRSFVTTLLSVLLVQNVFLGVFNLLPLPPLDGASVLRGVAPRGLASALDSLSTNPAFSLVGLFVAWQVFPAIANRLFFLLLAAVHPDVNYG
ncbi:MAG: site-2 protease family protein [Vicinamibacterales bacterium]